MLKEKFRKKDVYFHNLNKSERNWMYNKSISFSFNIKQVKDTLEKKDANNNNNNKFNRTVLIHPFHNREF